MYICWMHLRSNGDCCCMNDLNTERISKTQDVICLQQIYYTKKMKSLKVQTLIDIVTLIFDELNTWEVLEYP